MASNVLPQGKRILFNSISDQHLTHNHQLTIKAWNDIINILKVQANVNAEYLTTLHTWLIGEGNAVIPSERSFVEYVLEDLPQSIVNYIYNNSIQSDVIDIATLENYDVHSDNEVPTTRLVVGLINQMSTNNGNRLSVLPEVSSNANLYRVYLYAEDNGPPSKISVRNMLDSKIRTVDRVPANLQSNEYIFMEIE